MGDQMIVRRFYHCCWLLMLLLGPAPARAAEEAAADEVDLTSLRPPPRSINDITRMLGDYRQNEDLVSRLRQLADAPDPPAGETAGRFEFYWRRGAAAGELGRVQQQIADLRAAVAAGTPGTPDYARVLRNLAQAERLGGNFLSARREVEEAVRQIPATSPGQLTGAYAQVISIAGQVGDFETAQQALRSLEAVIDRLRRGKHWAERSHAWLANYEKARGDLFAMLGQAVEAEGAFRRALRENDQAEAGGGRPPPVLAVHADDGASPGREGLLRSLAQVLMAQGKLVEAEAVARQAVEKTLQRAGRAAPDTGRGLRLLATIIAEQGRYEESARLAEAALAAVLESGAAADSAVALAVRRSTLAAQVALGNDRRALEIFAEVRRLLQPNPQLAEQLSKGDLDVVLAWLRTGQPAPAERMAAQMLATRRGQPGDQVLRLAEVEAFLAMAQADLGQLPAALASFRHAVPVLIERVRRELDAQNGGMRRQQRLQIVLERYIRLLAEMRERGVVDDAATDEAFMLADEARGSAVQLALTRSAARAAIRDPQLAALARQEQDAQRRASALGELLSQLLAAAPDQQLPAIQARIRQDIGELTATRERIRREIGERFPDYARLVDPPPVDLRRVRQLLHPREALVAWYFGRQSGYVWLIRADGRTQFATLPVARREIAAQVASLRKALSPDVVAVDDIPPFDVPLAASLYRQLLAPVGELLDGLDMLLAVPHAELGQLPLSLLVTRPVPQPTGEALLFAGYRDVPWLMRRLAVAQLPSVTALAALRPRPAGGGARLPFAGFGDPLFSLEQAGARGAGVALRGGAVHLRNVPKIGQVDSAELAMLPRLPETADEIREIAAALGADASRDVFLNAAASERNVFATDLASRRVVMFATHGLVAGELDGLNQPALALSSPAVVGGDGDGLLTQEEILSLKLNADWVVLSACNTAAADAGGEAVSGLGRAFFYAGARALLVSDWPVESEAARRLMIELFRRQAAAPQLAKAEALRRSMAAVVDAPGRLDERSGKAVFSYAHPLFWAPFVVVGD